MKLTQETRVVLFAIIAVGFLAAMMWLFEQPRNSPNSPLEVSPEELYATASTEYMLGRYDAAAEKLKEIMTRHPSHTYADSAILLTRAIDSIKDIQDSISLIEEAASMKVEMKDRAAALLNMNKKVDEFTKQTWYRDKTSPTYVDVNSVYGYIGVDASGSPNLRLKIQYTGDDWLFIEKYIFLIDDQSVEVTENSYGEVESGNSGGAVWEWLDRSAGSAEIKLMHDIAGSKTAKIRYQGKNRHYDRVIKQQEKTALKNILIAFKALGGKL